MEQLLQDAIYGILSFDKARAKINWDIETELKQPNKLASVVFVCLCLVDISQQFVRGYRKHI